MASPWWCPIFWHWIGDDFCDGDEWVCSHSSSYIHYLTSSYTPGKPELSSKWAKIVMDSSMPKIFSGKLIMPLTSLKAALRAGPKVSSYSTMHLTNKSVYQMPYQHKTWWKVHWLFMFLLPPPPPSCADALEASSLRRISTFCNIVSSPLGLGHVFVAHDGGEDSVQPCYSVLVQYLTDFSHRTKVRVDAPP